MKKLLVSFFLFSSFVKAQEVVSFVQDGKYSLRKGNAEINAGETYGAIEKIAFPEYEINGRKYNYIFALYLGVKDVNNDYSEVKNTIKLAKANGSLISDNVFSNYLITEDQPISPNGLVVKIDGKWSLLSVLFELIITDYQLLQPFMDCFIAENYDEFHILDKDLKVLQTFENIEFFSKNNIEFLEDGDFYESITNIMTEPILKVYKTIDGQKKASIFDVSENELIADWMESGAAPAIEFKQIGKHPLYIFSNELTDNKGYYYKGMKIGTAIEYEVCDVFEYDECHLLKVKKMDEPFHSIFMLKGDSLKKIHQAPFIGSSSELSVFDEETKNNINFSKEFLITKDNSERMGLICLNGKPIDIYYDAFYPDQNYENIIHTERDQKYGFINLWTGKEIKPFNATRLKFENFEQRREIYTTIGSGSNKYYLSSNGNKFYSLKSEPTIFEKKRLFGLESMSDFSQKTTSLFSPKYISIKKITDNLYTVVNVEKKHGVISAFGDTIIEIKYENLIDAGHSNYWSGRNFFFYEKNKFDDSQNLVGLVSELQGEIIPAKYEEIKSYGDQNKMYNMYLVSNNNKWGLYSGKNPIFECKYKSIAHHLDMFDNDNWHYVAQLEDKFYSRLCYGISGQYIIRNLSRPYDYVVGNYGYVSIGSKFQRFSLNFDEPLELLDNMNSEFTNEYYSIIYKDGKFGARDLDNKQLTPYIYDEAYFKSFQEYTMIAKEKDIWYEIDVQKNSRIEIK